MNLFSSFIIFRVIAALILLILCLHIDFYYIKKSEQKYDYIETKEVDSHITSLQNQLLLNSTFYYNISLFNFLIFQVSLIKKYIHIQPVRPVIAFAHIGTLDSIGLINRLYIDGNIAANIITKNTNN